MKALDRPGVALRPGQTAHCRREFIKIHVCFSCPREAGDHDSQVICFVLSVFHQMNMLMRLQEAANYSSPQSYDSDSNSNSHHDDILDSSLESTL